MKKYHLEIAEAVKGSVDELGSLNVGEQTGRKCYTRSQVLLRVSRMCQGEIMSIIVVEGKLEFYDEFCWYCSLKKEIVYSSENGTIIVWGLWLRR